MLLIVAFVLVSVTYAQDAKQASLQKLINSKNFVFKARSAFPLRGGAKQLTLDYDLRVLGDSIVSYLPYFGRAYSAPIDPSEGGIHFISTDFTYKVKTNDKGWDITILPKDTRDVRQLFLSVTTSGYAQLQVLSNNREAISFNGRIEGRK